MSKSLRQYRKKRTRCKNIKLKNKCLNRQNCTYVSRSKRTSSFCRKARNTRRKKH